MAFVNERISDEERARLQPSFEKWPLDTNGKLLSWTVEREQDVFLYYRWSGRDRRGPNYLGLRRYSDGVPIAMVTAPYKTNPKDAEGHSVFEYTISRLWIAPEFSEQWPHVVQLLRDGLGEFGFAGRRVEGRTVTVEVPEEILVNLRGKFYAVPPERGQLWLS